MPDCDVIIPTYNSRATIGPTIRALFAQVVPSGWTARVIVSDDGSTDDTISRAARPHPPSPWQTTLLLSGPHTGAAGARNRGLARSRAAVIFWLGADILLRPGALAAHLNFHTAHPSPQHAALGLVKWDPRLRPSPFMEWVVHGGGQNNFDDLLGRDTADPCRFFYASHLSLKRELMQHQHFPEVYRTYGWEDSDLGRTLAPKLRLHVVHGALGLHHHYYQPYDIYRRQLSVGRNLITYQRRYPGTPLLPRRRASRRYAQTLLDTCGLSAIFSWWVSKSATRWSTPRVFATVTALHFWRGVQYQRKLSTEI